MGGYYKIRDLVYCSSCARAYDKRSRAERGLSRQEQDAADWRCFREDVRKSVGKSLDIPAPAVIITGKKDKSTTANLSGERRKMETNGNGRKKVETRARELLEKANAMKAQAVDGGRAVIEQTDLIELVELHQKLKVANDALRASKAVLTALAAKGAVIEAGTLSIQKQEEAGSRSWPKIVKAEFGDEKYKALLADDNYKPAPAQRWRVVDALTGKRVDD